MLRKSRLMILAASTLVSVGLPSSVSAHDEEGQWSQHDDGDDEDHPHYVQRRDDGYYGHDHFAGPRYDGYCRRSDGTTGLIVGGVAGALLGREIGRPRHRSTGTIVGAGVGALAGRAIERGRDC